MLKISLLQMHGIIPVFSVLFHHCVLLFRPAFAICVTIVSYSSVRHSNAASVAFSAQECFGYWGRDLIINLTYLIYEHFGHCKNHISITIKTNTVLALVSVGPVSQSQ